MSKLMKKPIRAEDIDRIYTDPRTCGCGCEENCWMGPRNIKRLVKLMNKHLNLVKATANGTETLYVMKFYKKYIYTYAEERDCHEQLSL